MDYDDLEILTPRRRRLLRWAAGVALVLVAAAVAVHLVGRLRLEAIRREQARHGPLDPAAYAPPVAPAADNAVRALFAAAADIEVDPEDLRPLIAASHQRPEGWPAEVRAAVARHLAANAEALDGLHRGAALAGGGLGLDYALLDPLGTSTLRDPIEATQLLELAGETAVTAGDRESALAAVETLGRLAALLHAEPDPFLQFLALNAGAAQLRVVRELVAAGATGADLPRLASALAGTADRAAVGRTIRRQTALFVGPEAGRVARHLGRQAGGVWQAVSWIAGELFVAEALAGRVWLARVDQWTYPTLAATVDYSRSPLPLGPFEAIHLHLQVLAIHVDAAAAARQLAEIALALTAAGTRHGSYPAALADLGRPAALNPDPLTSSWPDYEIAADGSARLSLDHAEAQAGSEGSLSSFPFVWEFPPP